MYLHLGQNVVVKTAEIIGIFDLDACTVNKITKNYLYNSEKEKNVITISMDLPKSFVVCEDKIYISPLAASTLTKRNEMGNFFE